MTNKRFIAAYEKIEPSPEARERVWERLMEQSGGFSPETEVTMKAGRHRKRFRTVLIAALITSMFAAGAYAADFMGMRAIRIQDGEDKEEENYVNLNGEAKVNRSTDSAKISLSQPQEIPGEMDPAIAERVANSRAAWSEWSAWIEEYRPKLPEVFEAPEKGMMFFEAAEDGGCAIVIKKYPEWDYKSGEPRPEAFDHPEAWEVVETRAATAEECRQQEEYMNSLRCEYGEYDFNYGVFDQQSAEKLEETAAKYGLKLRRGCTLAWEENKNYSGEGTLSKEEIIQQIIGAGCRDNPFREMPELFEKVYYYDEGSFCVSTYVNLPSSGEQIGVYAYNSMYGTLSSGEEAFTTEENISGFVARTHVTPDGTEVTILRNGDSAYIYVYLENSFFNQHVCGTEDMTDEDVDYIADMIAYTNIGK